jgi:aspartate racemase
MLHSVSGFLQQCSDWEITVLDLPTAYWHELTAFMCENRLSLPRSVRLVIIGGEPALPERIEAWRVRVAPSVRLLNTYGPTEATIVSTIADLSPPARPQEIINDVHVGRPIPHSRIYILDQHSTPVPIGVVGELHIGGTGLARGYLNRPALTAEKFIPDLFTDAHGARLYKTGDLARYSSDGSIQITGRADNQVKLNGFRIELGEIETALRSCEDVHDAIAAIREDSFETRRLVAYVVPSQKTGSLPALKLRDQLRNQLKKKLPRHMVPSLFVVLDELPLTDHGKIDRARLPAPEFDGLSHDTYVRPRDPLEKQLAEIWEDILNVSPIGIKEDFFDLGGHSLLSVRMMSRVERITGERLPLALLFEEATIEHLAAVILDQGKCRSRSAIVKVKDGGPKLPFFFLHGDFNGGGFYCRNLAGGLGDDRPFYVIQPHGLDGGPIPVTIEQMAESHLRALQEVQPRGPYLLGGYCNGATIAFEMARLLKSRGETIDLLVLLCSSISGAVRFKRLYDLVNRYRNIGHLGAEERAAHFLAYRERFTRVWGIRDYYKARLTELLRMRRKDQVGFVYEKTRRTLSRLAGILAPGRANGGASALVPVSDSSSPMESDRRQRATDAYTRAILAYVPGLYVGPVTLLWPTELDLEDPADPTAGWSSVASSVDVQRVPGGHITCVTNHVHELAMMLKNCLNKLPAGVDSTGFSRQ